MFKRCIFSNCQAKICFICIVELKLMSCLVQIWNERTKNKTHTHTHSLFSNHIILNVAYCLLSNILTAQRCAYHSNPHIIRSFSFRSRQTIHFLNFLLGFRLWFLFPPFPVVVTIAACSCFVRLIPYFQLLALIYELSIKSVVHVAQ